MIGVVFDLALTCVVMAPPFTRHVFLPARRARRLARR